MNAALLEAPEGALTIPRTACLLQEQDAPIVLAEITEAGTKSNKFEMVALTGKPLRHWWYGTLAIELSGIKFKKRMPVLKDHDVDQRIGYTTALRVDESRGLIAEGHLLQTSEAAKEVLADSREGFPWQASTYLEPRKIVRLGDGEEAECNGRKVKGPGVIFRECTLREVTFTALGVDDDTSATSLSAKVAGDVVAVLSLNQQTMTKTTEGAAPVAAAAPVAPAVSTPVDTAKLAADATAVERTRVDTILSSAADCQVELARKLVKDGVALSDALVQLNQDLRTRLAAQSPDPKATKSLARGNTSRVAPAEDDRQESDERAAEAPKLSDIGQHSTDEEIDAAWKAADSKLRKEFDNDKELFAFSMRNQRAHKQFQTKAQFEAATQGAERG